MFDLCRSSENPPGMDISNNIESSKKTNSPNLPEARLAPSRLMNPAWGVLASSIPPRNRKCLTSTGIFGTRMRTCTYAQMALRLMDPSLRPWVFTSSGHGSRPQPVPNKRRGPDDVAPAAAALDLLAIVGVCDLRICQGGRLGALTVLPNLDQLRLCSLERKHRQTMETEQIQIRDRQCLRSVRGTLRLIRGTEGQYSDPTGRRRRQSTSSGHW